METWIVIMSSLGMRACMYVCVYTGMGLAYRISLTAVTIPPNAMSTGKIHALWYMYAITPASKHTATGKRACKYTTDVPRYVWIHTWATAIDLRDLFCVVVLKQTYTLTYRRPKPIIGRKDQCVHDYWHISIPMYLFPRVQDSILRSRTETCFKSKTVTAAYQCCNCGVTLSHSQNLVSLSGQTLRLSAKAAPTTRATPTALRPAAKPRSQSWSHEM